MDSNENFTVIFTQTDETDLSTLVDESSDSDNEIIETCPNNRFQKVFIKQFNTLLRSSPFTKTFRALDSKNGSEVTWISISIPIFTTQDLELISSRIKITSQHKNLTKVEAIWINEGCNEIVIITEKITGSSVSHYIAHLPQPRLKLIKIWSRGILEGLEYLHSETVQMVHGELASSNVWVMSQDGTVKLSDFFLNDLFHSKSQIFSNFTYSSPEFLKGNQTFKSDIYSFGIILLEMCTKEKPFEECSTFSETFKKIKKNQHPASFFRIKDNQIKEIIRKCLSPAELRPSASDLLSDPFFDWHSNFKDSLRVSVLSPQLRVPHHRSLIANISILLKDSSENLQEISFNYSSLRDSSEKVAMEMVETLNLSKFCLLKLADEIQRQVNLHPPLSIKVFKNQRNSFEPNTAVIEPGDISKVMPFKRMSQDL
jgi:WNK lysine deficient protein kinase